MDVQVSGLSYLLEAERPSILGQIMNAYCPSVVLRSCASCSNALCAPFSSTAAANLTGGTNTAVNGRASSMDSAGINAVIGKAQTDLLLLNNVSFHCKPGTVTVFMGLGMGYKTLLECVALRQLEGLMHGQIEFDGHIRPLPTALAAQVNGTSRLSGASYRDICLLYDIGIAHFTSLTVFDHLYYAARLRMTAGDIGGPATGSTSGNKTDPTSSATPSQCRERARIVARRLGLPSNKTISLLTKAELRILDIASELVSSPSLLCLIDPLEGLDASDKLQVMKILYMIAHPLTATGPSSSTGTNGDTGSGGGSSGKAFHSSDSKGSRKFSTSVNDAATPWTPTTIIYNLTGVDNDMLRYIDNIGIFNGNRLEYYRMCVAHTMRYHSTNTNSGTNGTSGNSSSTKQRKSITHSGSMVPSTATNPNSYANTILTNVNSNTTTNSSVAIAVANILQQASLILSHHIRKFPLCINEVDRRHSIGLLALIDNLIKLDRNDPALLTRTQSGSREGGNNTSIDAMNTGSSRFMIDKRTKKEDFVSMQGAYYSSSNPSNGSSKKKGKKGVDNGDTPTVIAAIEDLLRKRKPLLEEFTILTSRALTNHRKNVSMFECMS